MSITELSGIDKYILYWFNGSNSLFEDGLVSLLTSGMTWIPLYIALFYLVMKNNDTMGQIMLIVGSIILCIILTGGIDDIFIKPWIGRVRPCNDPDINAHLNLITGQVESGFSFFSAHAANTMSLAVFLCLLIKDSIFKIVMIGWSLLNGWSRLYLGVHFPSDVLFGFLYGAVIGILIFSFYKRFYSEMSFQTTYISSQYTSSGYERKDIDVVLVVFLLTTLTTSIISFLNVGLF
ncbi:MAG: phosphatase PAP2 family protein [Prevotellaceae bacterium]|nr:phosphatase PAP2 family protein [Prevotellaceae bacterium]